MTRLAAEPRGSHPVLCFKQVFSFLACQDFSFSYGGKGIRTPDIQLAKLALYQLSYAPAWLSEMENLEW